MKMKILSFIALYLLLLVTGVFWGTWFALSRSIDEFSTAEFIHIGKVIIANVGVPMSIIMPLCILSMVLCSISYSPKNSIGFYFSLTALTLIIVTLLLTVLILVPIDNQIKHWTLLTVPSDWTDIRKSWEFYHSLRTFTSLSSFACFALSIMNNEKTN